MNIETSISYSLITNNPPHEWKLIKHNANDDANIERVEEKLLYWEK